MSFNSLKNNSDDVIKALKETDKLATLLKAKKDKQKLKDYEDFLNSQNIGSSTFNFKQDNNIMSKCIQKNCDGELEFNESKGVYSEHWFCVECDTDYSVDVELVRDFKNMERIPNTDYDNRYPNGIKIRFSYK